MKTVLLLALFGMLLVAIGWPLIRSDSITPNGGRALFGYTLAYVGVILIFVAAARAAA